jgi:hypothetical protein
MSMICLLRSSPLPPFLRRESVLSVASVTVTIILSVLPAYGQAPRRDLRVLFIGNSLTSINDLPGLVRKLGASDGLTIRTKMVALDDSSLEDHWNRGEAAREIGRGRWDFVVLQQGPSSLPASRVMLRDYVGRFAGVIRAAGAKPAIYMVWPSLARKGDFDRVSESYRLAAADVDGVLLPAGDAWRARWSFDAGAALYAHDNFHPSSEGSWLAALVIYCRLSERPPTLLKLPKGFPARPDPLLRSAEAALSLPQATGIGRRRRATVTFDSASIRAPS